MPSRRKGKTGLLHRPRRWRHSVGMREMLRQVTISPSDLIYPLVVTHENGVRREIPSMPGQFHLSLENLIDEAKYAHSIGIHAILLFGIPATKDATGSDSFSENGIVQMALRELKFAVPELTVIANTCLCAYTDGGHCGILNVNAEHLPRDYVLNDETLKVLREVVVAQASAGADIVSPSGMMDGVVLSLREALDEAAFEHVSIMPHSVKYMSGLQSSQCNRSFGDVLPSRNRESTYQMDCGNLDQAFVEAAQDVEQGADYLMVEPALSYLDIITKVKAQHPATPLVAYNACGAYAMVKAAANAELIDEQTVVMEMLTGIKRAGADLIITHHAKDVCKWLEPVSVS